MTAATSTVLLHRLLPLAATTGPGAVMVVNPSAVTELDGVGVGVLCALRAQARITGGDCT